MINNIMDILKKIPIELKQLVISFIPRPPHYLAMKKGLIPVFDREINSKIDGEITLYDELDIEWEEFASTVIVTDYTPSQSDPLPL